MDETARIWDTTTGTQLTALTGHDDTANDVAFSPDGTQLATSSDDETAMIWSVDDDPVHGRLRAVPARRPNRTGATRPYPAAAHRVGGQ